MTERLIAITVQAYLNHLERTEEAWCNAATERNVQRWTSVLSEEACIEECDNDVLAWGLPHACGRYRQQERCTSVGRANLGSTAC